jgi:quercetin dioxygenase-like cupin family protein
MRGDDTPEMDPDVDNEPEGIDTRCFEHVAASVIPSKMAGEIRERIWARIHERVESLPASGTRTVRAEGSEWIALNPLVRFRRLRVDIEARNQTVLLRAEPGGFIPRHRHSQDEEFIVLEGECHIGSHHLRTGDAHFASAGSWHDVITTQTGVLILVRGEYQAAASV